MLSVTIAMVDITETYSTYIVYDYDIRTNNTHPLYTIKYGIFTFSSLPVHLLEEAIYYPSPSILSPLSLPDLAGSL